MTKTAEVKQFTGLAELVKLVQAGNEVVLTKGNKPVAKIISATVSQSIEDSEAEFHRAVELAGGEPKKRFTKKDESMVNRIIKEYRATKNNGHS